jgi:TRAP-type C4-dicarboxylate transport system permease small subunit
MGQGLLKSCHDKLLHVIGWLITIMAAVLIIVVFSNVIGRYFFHFALAWAEETARFLFIWLSFMGAVLANAHYGHMNLDIFVKWAPRKVGQAMMVVADIVILIILGLLVDGGITMTVQNYNWQTPALEISYGLVYSIGPIACAIMFLQTMARLYRQGRALLGAGGDDDTPEGGDGHASNLFD